MTLDRYPSVALDDAIRTAGVVFDLDVLVRSGLDLGDKELVVQLAARAIQHRVRCFGVLIPELPDKPLDDLPDCALRVVAGLRKAGWTYANVAADDEGG